MSHFGVLSHKSTGHLNPMIALSRQLMDRGHRVTFFQKPEVEAQVRQHGMEFVPIGPPQENTRASGNNHLSSIGTLRLRIRQIVADMELFLAESPAALAHAAVDTLIMDEIALSGPTIAEMLRLPYFVVSTSVPHNFGWSAPRRMSPPSTLFGRVRNALLHVSILRMRGPIRRSLDRARQQAGLGPIREIDKTFPAVAHIAQMPECIDLPRSVLPHNFYYTGPFVREAARRAVEFPWDRLDARPLVYASLGTTRKSEPAIFRMTAEACEALNLQLVISLGGRRDPEMFVDLPGSPIVVRETPQLELIKRADVVITHGGLNTALETLMEGKPMIVIPKDFDQPAVAARLERLGVAEVLPSEGLSAKMIRTALAKVVNDPNYRESAREVQRKVLSTRGLEHAADVIEGLMEKRQQAIHA